MPKDTPKRIKQKYFEGETSLDSKMKKLSISCESQKFQKKFHKKM